MIEIMATLKGVVIKSKVSNNEDTIHFLDLKLEVHQGVDRIQELIGHLKDVMLVTLDSKQPSLPVKPYKDDEDK